MLLTTLQWNIGGARIRGENDDPLDEAAYQHESLDYFISTLQPLKPDIICLQETHASPKQIQAQAITAELGLANYISDVYDHSHIDDTCELGQAIICRFPLTDHSFRLFNNPRLEVDRPNGEHWISHDKGVTTCQTIISGQTVCLKTTHMIPFRKFKRDPMEPEFKNLRQDIENKLRSDQQLTLLHGDFNWDGASLQDFLPGLDLQEVKLTAPTTPRGRKYDRVLYQGLRHRSSKVLNNVLTDHFPIYSKFEV